MWKGDKTRRYKETNLIYNEKGEVYYVPEYGKEIKLINKGYDKRTDSLRYGFHPKENDKRIFRIKIKRWKNF